MLVTHEQFIRDLERIANAVGTTKTKEGIERVERWKISLTQEIFEGGALTDEWWPRAVTRLARRSRYLPKPIEVLDAIREIQMSERARGIVTAGNPCTICGDWNGASPTGMLWVINGSLSEVVRCTCPNAPPAVINDDPKKRMPTYLEYIEMGLPGTVYNKHDRPPFGKPIEPPNLSPGEKSQLLQEAIAMVSRNMGAMR